MVAAYHDQETSSSDSKCESGRGTELQESKCGSESCRWLYAKNKMKTREHENKLREHSPHKISEHCILAIVVYLFPPFLLIVSYKWSICQRQFIGTINYTGANRVMPLICSFKWHLSCHLNEHFWAVTKCLKNLNTTGNWYLVSIRGAH